MPNSNDQSLFLERGLRAREHRAMKRLVAAANTLAGHPGQTSGRVVAFTGAGMGQSKCPAGPAEVIPLAKRNAGRTELKLIQASFGAALPETTA